MPSVSFANQSGLETIQQKWNITDEDLEKSLELISNNQELFLEFADEEILNSYNIEDKNAALLQYYLSTNQIENSVNTLTLTSDNEIIAQPTWAILVRLLVSNAVKKKMGKEVTKRIGNEVEAKVIPKFKDAAEEAGKKYTYKSSKGPTVSGGNGINQGEHIISLQDNAGDYIRFHVNLNSSRNTSTWHWHLRDDNFQWHYGQIQLKHNSLPKWGD